MIPAGPDRRLGRLEGAGQRAGQEHGHHLVGLVPGIAEDPDELGRRGLRGRGEVLRGAEPAVELLRLELDPIPEDLVAEDDLERDERDVMPVEHRVGEVGGAVA